MKTIVLALDFNGSHDVLVNKGKDMAAAFDAKLYLLHIASPNPEFVGYEAGPDHERDHRAKELREEHRQLQELAQVLEEEGLNAEALLIQGMTIEMLLKKAGQLKADLIIAGTHHHSFMYNAFIGSTSAELFRKSEIAFMGIPLNDEQE